MSVKPAYPTTLTTIDLATPGRIFYSVTLDGVDVSHVCVAANAEEGWVELNKFAYLKSGTLTSFDYKAETADVRSVDRSAVRSVVHTSKTRYRYALALELKDERDGADVMRPYYVLTDDGTVATERKTGSVVIELRKPKHA